MPARCGSEGGVEVGDLRMGRGLDGAVEVDAGLGGGCFRLDI